MCVACPMRNFQVGELQTGQAQSLRLNGTPVKPSFEGIRADAYKWCRYNLDSGIFE